MSKKVGHKNVIFILGMHRSGTSAMAGSIFHCGISGGEDLMGPAFDNQKGFFENRMAFQLNEAILEKLGLSWDSLFNLQEDWYFDGRLEQLKLSIRNFLHAALENHQTIFIKDPRLSVLLPLWHTVLEDMEVDAKHIVMIREPEEVYRSLKKRNGMDRNEALSLWLNYMLLAEKNTRGLSRQFVTYSELLTHPLETLQGIWDKFGLDKGAEALNTANKKVLDFLSPKLRHHQVDESSADYGIFSGFPKFLSLLDKLQVEPPPPNLYAKLDALWQQYQDGLYFFNPKSRNTVFATLKWGNDQATNQNAPIKRFVGHGRQKISFALDGQKTTEATKLWIYLSNELAYLRLLSCQGEWTGGEKRLLESNVKVVSLEHGDDYFVGPNDHFRYDFSNDGLPLKVHLEVEYFQFGERAVNRLHDLSAKVKGWFYDQMNRVQKAAEEKVAELQQEIDVAQNDLARQTKELTEIQNVFAQREKNYSEQVAMLEASQNNLSETIAKIEADRGQMQAELTAAIAEVKAEREQVRTELTQVIDQTLAKAEAEHQRAQKELNAVISEAKAEQESFQTKLADAQEATQKLQAEVTVKLDAIHHLQGQLEERELMFSQSKEYSEKLELELKSTKQQLKNEQDQVQDLLQNLKDAETDLAAKLQRIDEIEHKIQERDDQIWRLYANQQSAEGDYRQALTTLKELKTSLTYRLGSVLTAPFRFIYDRVSKQPFNTTRLWLFFQFLGTAFRQPFHFLTQVNQGNLRTLKKALKNEPPKTIATNLRKKLMGSEQLDAQEALPEVPLFLNDHEEKLKAVPKPLPTKVKTVLFVSPFLPDFDSSSGGKRATRMLGLLAENYNVYAFTLGEKPERHIAKLEGLGVRVFRESKVAAVGKMLPKVDTIIFSFFYTYFDCGALLAFFPQTKVIVDSVDVHWVRHERSLGLWEELTEQVVREKKQLEIEVYSKADIVWAVTEQDHQAILEEVPGADVRIVSNIHQPQVSTYQDPGTHRLLFLGGFSHYPNVIAVEHLVKNIFPKIRAEHPEAQLVIAGSKAPEKVEDYGNLPGVEFLGFIPDEEISQLYAESFLALAPLQTGAGIKGKICEAISYMVPVVTNRIGNEGIELVNEKSGLISDDDDELVQLTVRALHREFDLAEMTHNAQAKLYDLVGPQVVKNNMLRSIDLPEVSICIVTWNRLELLKRCIESIEGNTRYPHYKILVHSNGCEDGTQDYLLAAAKLNPRIVPILSETNDVFVIPNNQMMELFPKNDVVLVNNDVYVTPGWLMALQEAAYAQKEIGIVGSKILYPDGRLQEFGSELYSDGTGRNIGKFDEPTKPEYREEKYVGYVSGCSFYVKRETIDTIGVFDEDFHPCYCEDSDYCYTAWEHGIQTMVTPKSVIYHDEGGTSGTDTSSGFKAYQKVNFEKFLAKHKDNLDSIASQIKLLNQIEEPEPIKQS